MTLQEMIEAITKELGISQAQLGRMAGLPQQYINRAAKGGQLSYKNGKEIEALYKRTMSKPKSTSKPV